MTTPIEFSPAEIKKMAEDPYILTHICNYHHAWEAQAEAMYDDLLDSPINLQRYEKRRKELKDRALSIMREDLDIWPDDLLREVHLQMPEAPAYTKPSPELLTLATDCGAKLTGEPNGSEPVTVVFSIEAWRKFDKGLRTHSLQPIIQHVRGVRVNHDSVILTTKHDPIHGNIIARELCGLFVSLIDKKAKENSHE